MIPSDYLSVALLIAGAVFFLADILLEMSVLFVALLGVWSLGREAEQRPSAPGLVLDTLARLLAPMLILVAAYLLWVDAHATGGAFQAGSVLGA